MKSVKDRFILPRVVSVSCIYIFAVLYMFPIIVAIINSFKEKREILISPITFPSVLYFGNYAEVFLKTNFFVVFLNSVLLTGLSVVLLILVSSLAGYSIARWKSKSANFLMVIFLCALFVPFHTIMITLLKTAKEVGAIGSLPGMILIYGGLMCPIPIFLYRGFVKSLPMEIEESAVIDGCGILSMVFRIVFPLLKPVTSTIAVLNALWIWNDFLLPYLVLAKPITVPLSQMFFYGKYNQQWHLIMAGFVISTLPIVVFFLIMQKYIIKGIVSGALKG